MNITRISLKHTTENIQIPDWAKTIVIHADTTAPYSEKKNYSKSTVCFSKPSASQTKPELNTRFVFT